MPTYRVEFPDGRRFEINSPGPLSQAQILQQFQKQGPSGLTKALDLATGIGSFIPFAPIAIPSRIAQAGFAVKKGLEGDYLGAGLSALPAALGRGLKAANATIQAAPLSEAFQPSLGLGRVLTKKGIPPPLTKPFTTMPKQHAVPPFAASKKAYLSKGLEQPEFPRLRTTFPLNLSRFQKQGILDTTMPVTPVRRSARLGKESQLGRISPSLLASLGLGGAGAVSGAAIGETPEEKALLAATLGSAGAVLPQILKSGQVFPKKLGPVSQTAKRLPMGRGSVASPPTISTEQELQAQMSKVFTSAFKGRISKDQGRWLSSGTMAASAGLGAVGALAGAAAGEDDNDRIANGVLFGTGGALLPIFLSQVQAGLVAPKLHQALMNTTKGMKGFRYSKEGVKQGVDSYRYNAMLSTPGAIGRANGGAFAAGMMAAGQMMATGNVRGGVNTLKELLSPSTVDRWIQVVQTPGTLSQAVQRIPGQVYPSLKSAKGILTIPSRLVRAGDEVVTDILRRNGFPEEEIARLTLSGQPTSPWGIQALRMLTAHWWMRLLVPFPRVAIQSLERGVEFSPLGLSKGISQAGTGRVLPFAERAYRAGTGTALTGVGIAAGASDLPRSLGFSVAALGGPANLPMLIGFALGESLQRGEAFPETLDDILKQLEHEMPLPDINAIQRFLRGQQFVPGFLNVLGRATDPFERETRGQGFFAPTQRMIPGLRENLPPRVY